MDNLFDQEELKTQQARTFHAGFQVFDAIEKWLAGLFELTEEVQEVAALYLDEQR